MLSAASIFLSSIKASPIRLRLQKSVVSTFIVSIINRLEHYGPDIGDKIIKISRLFFRQGMFYLETLRYVPTSVKASDNIWAAMASPSAVMIAASFSNSA